MANLRSTACAWLSDEAALANLASICCREDGIWHSSSMYWCCMQVQLGQSSCNLEVELTSWVGNTMRQRTHAPAAPVMVFQRLSVTHEQISTICIVEYMTLGPGRNDASKMLQQHICSDVGQAMPDWPPPSPKSALDVCRTPVHKAFWEGARPTSACVRLTLLKDLLISAVIP